MHSGKLNKTRYDDLGKPMKQISFTIKNLEGNLPKKQSTIIKRCFRSNTKNFVPNSTIPVDKLIGSKWAYAFLEQKFQRFAQFPKLIREIPLFCNSIYRKSSYNKLKIKKKNYWNLRSMQFFKAI